ncbi:transmembrane emp24 domain-containing protein 10-like [Centropristis striata]|uniref:transmembrane emp24 domain-containing protein 10-like n=1 Tax=Centropristis striata TaxID=184440 RepID=UPI0027DF1A58|nr:transmembrane emp24 domain-containing protein 10-like [Centropristis striata]
MTRNWREEEAGSAYDSSSITVLSSSQSGMSSMSRRCVLLLIPVLLDPVLSITFHLPVNSQKCLQGNIRKHLLVSGSYQVSEHPHITTDLKITDSFGDTLYAKENATKGIFAFSTENHDKFDICFNSRSPMGSGGVHELLVKIDMKYGMKGNTYKEIDSLNPLEAQLKHLEDLSQSIADDFTNLKNRGKEMRQTNESTNMRVQLFSFISVCGFLALATWQIFYLRRYFKTKKFIE